MASHIFIDANIFLNFYDFNDEDLEQLKKLVDFINKKKVILYITQQLKDEVERHRDEKVGNSFNRFKKSRCNLEMPVICKTYPEYDIINNLQDDLEKNKSVLSNKLWEDIANHTLKADDIIFKLIEAGNFVDSDKFINKAIVRHRKGNPPGKKNDSYGDEINWETLLGAVPDEKDFIIISRDGDYQNAINSEELNSFLKSEWQKKKKSKIYLYKNLTNFFNKQKIAIQLRFEEEKNNLIKSLLDSPTFAATHEIIDKLSKFGSFTDEQTIGLVAALLNNTQVGFIVNDSDVNEFYRNLLNYKDNLSDEKTWGDLNDVLCDKQVNYLKTVNDLPF